MMTCYNIFKTHKEKHQAENRVTVVKNAMDRDSFYLCAECTENLLHHDDYQKHEIVVEKIIHKDEKSS